VSVCVCGCVMFVRVCVRAIKKCANLSVRNVSPTTRRLQVVLFLLLAKRRSWGCRNHPIQKYSEWYMPNPASTTMRPTAPCAILYQVPAKLLRFKGPSAQTNFTGCFLSMSFFTPVQLHSLQRCRFPLSGPALKVLQCCCCNTLFSGVTAAWI
jgi:hypothetical protein